MIDCFFQFIQISADFFTSIAGFSVILFIGILAIVFLNIVL